MFPLITPRFFIRPFTPDDIPQLAEAVRESKDTLGRWLSWCTDEYSIPEMSRWVAQSALRIKEGMAFDLAIIEQNFGRLMGSVGINSIQSGYQMGNIGYWVRQSEQGQQIALEAVKAITAFGFDQLGLTRLEIIAAEQNLPSRRIAEKAGARFEGIAYNRLVIHGHPTDAAMYSLIPTR
ncbi:GNAT family N-acetyltransferase [Lonsdalea quercina]|uniref:GNAT family N-acetyltransferase n=1 Tax=Lonsdalea quercina TaxID=71657 RepID=UPI0039747F73